MEIRCLLTQDKNVWVAMSLDFGLAAQANTKEEATQKLESQIKDYLMDACTVDRAFQQQLLKRKGPLIWFFIYYWRLLGSKFNPNGTPVFFSKNTKDYPSHA